MLVYVCILCAHCVCVCGGGGVDIIKTLCVEVLCILYILYVVCMCNESPVSNHPINAFCIQYLAQTIIS